MSNRSPNKASRVREEADAVFDVDMPFQYLDSMILLQEKSGDEIEVIVGNIPTPSNLDTERNSPESLKEEDTKHSYLIAQWIFEGVVKNFRDYDWETSDYKTNSGNRHIRDIYFTCELDEIDEAVLAAKKFLMELEEQTYRHSKKFGRGYFNPL